MFVNLLFIPLSPMAWALIGVLIWVCIYVAIYSRRAKRKNDALIQRFLTDEEEANAAKKRPLDAELFFTADLSALPAIPENDPFNVIRAANRKMIRFANPISNVELKNRYGRLQLEYLAHYEENFNEYLRALTKWAEALITQENTTDALQVLEHALGLGSEFRRTYKFTADIYATQKDEKKLDDLLSRAACQVFRDPATGNYIIEYIREKIKSIS